MATAWPRKDTVAGARTAKCRRRSWARQGPMPGFLQVAPFCEMERWNRENQDVENSWDLPFWVWGIETATEPSANSAWLAMSDFINIFESWRASFCHPCESLCCQVIVFCQSVNTAHRLARLLQICCALRKVGEEAEEEAKTDDELLQETCQHWQLDDFELERGRCKDGSSLALIHAPIMFCSFCWGWRYCYLPSGFSLGQSEATVATCAI